MKKFSRLWQYLAELFLEWETLQIQTGEKIKSHILCSLNFFFENTAVYKITSNILVESERPQMII